MKFRVFTEADERCNATWAVLDENDRGWLIYWTAPAAERTGRFALLGGIPKESFCRPFILTKYGHVVGPCDGSGVVGLPKSESLSALLAKMGIDDWEMADDR